MQNQRFKCIGIMRGHSKKTNKDYTMIHYLIPLPNGGSGFSAEGFSGQVQYFDSLTGYDVKVGSYVEFVTGINVYGKPAIVDVRGIDIEEVEQENEV